MTTPQDQAPDETRSSTPMSREQADSLLHTLEGEYVEGLELSAQERDKAKERAEIEAQLPGVTEMFESLIERLPSPYSSEATEFPIGAMVVRKTEEGKLIIVSLASNQVNKAGDSLEHAETVALREAQEAAGSKHLTDHFLLSTVEPCTQCCGAAVNTEVSGVVYGATHADVAGTHALVDGQYKPFRTSPDTFDAKTYLGSQPDMLVIGGFMEDEIKERMTRVPTSFKEHYLDPDIS
jgi:tRNA(adenine34) deaminase